MANDILEKYSDLNFVQRVLNPAIFPNIQNDDGSVSTHRMAAEVDETGNWFVFPTIVQSPSGDLVELPPREAMAYAKQSGEIIPFGRDARASIEFSKNYKTPQMQGQGDQYQPGSAPIVQGDQAAALTHGMDVPNRKMLDVQTPGVEGQPHVIINVLGLGPMPITFPDADQARQYLQNPDMLKGLLDNKFSEARNFIDRAYEGLSPRDKAALWTSPIPVVGDAVGLYADTANMIQDPESRTVVNAILAAATAISAAPSKAQLEVMTKLKDNLFQMNRGAFSPNNIDSRFTPQVRKREGVPNVPTGPESKRLDEFSTGLETRNIEIPQMSIVDLEGKPFITTMSDRSAAGGVLTDIKGSRLDVPVDLRGGQDYMFDSMNSGQVWASDPRVVKQMQDAARMMYEETGEMPMFLPWRMAPTGIDYATMTTEAMLGYARTNMSPSDIRDANNAIRVAGRTISKKDNVTGKTRKVHVTVPEFKGIENPDSIAQLSEISGDQRKAIQQIMDVDFRNKGSISLPEARLAVSDYNQMNRPVSGLQNVGRVDVNSPILDRSGHPTYRAGLPGEGLGVLKEDIQAYQLMPEVARGRGIIDPTMPSAEDVRSLQMKPFTGIITDKILKDLGL